MGEITATGYLILGLLHTRDWSAYELVEQVGRGVTEVWHRADRQMYDAPKRLVQHELITARREQSAGRRERTVYSITAAGRAALAEWVATDITPSTMEFEGMVRMLFADAGSVEDLRRTLTSVVAQATERREMFVAYARIIAETGGTFPEREHLFALANRYLVDHYAHQAAWADWALGEIDGWPDTVTPATTRHDQTVATLEQISRSRTQPRSPT